jgi:small conductance mechanosensitive channel
VKEILIMNNIKVLILAFFAALFLTVAGDLQAQENTGGEINALEAAQLNSVNPESLPLFIVPLTAKELGTVAEAWQEHLQAKLEDSINLNLKLDVASEEAGIKLRSELLKNTEEQAAIVNNYKVVLEGWSAKGGTPEELLPHQQYINALTIGSLRTTDPRTLMKLVFDWVFSKDGGLSVIKGIVLAIVALIVLIFGANLTRGLARRWLEKIPKMSRLLKRFVLVIVYWLTLVTGTMLVLGLAGYNITALFAVFGGLSFILGFALQDTLSNLASGLMMMILKPFDTGDFIEISGASGVVDDMSVVSTQIRTFDNQIIIVPNSKIWGDIIVNVSAADTRRVDMVFGIAYSDNAQHAIKVLWELVNDHPKCITDPPTEIFVGELGESSVNIFCRPWVATDDYWIVYWDVIGQAKERFDQEGISIPFPQRDVHLIRQE